jgi:lysozyme family protein
MPISPAEALRANPKTAAATALALAATLAAVYANEGGYVDHPHDRGGKTRYGVTEQVARQWGYTGAMRDFPKHCDAGRPVCADRIYTAWYIDGPGYRPFAAIEPAVLDELVDSAVLHGPARASGWFQLSLNATCGARLKVDARVGPATVAAYRQCQQHLGRAQACRMVLDRLDRAQLAFFDTIVARRPAQRIFYRGWTTHRIGNVPRAKCGSGVA